MEDLFGGRTTNQDSSEICRDEIQDALESTRLEMKEAREENRRLKTQLNQIMEDYQTLYRKYTQIFPENPNKPLEITLPEEKEEEEEVLEDSDFVSLSLGRTRKLSDAGEPRIKDQEKNKTLVVIQGGEVEEVKGSLDFELDFGIGKSNEDYPEPAGKELSGDYGGSRESSLGFGTKERKEEESKKTTDHVNDLYQDRNAKKTRVSVRARCDTTTMNDGCQWRKYGQKISKGSPCPRAYYRCSLASSCPVKKQVQRCPEDMTILITTYEGTHNHPLPISATAMTSATSAAAMLVSSTVTTSHSPTTTQNQFHITNSSSSSSHPTITLDLTSSSSLQSSSSSSSSSIFNRYFSSTTDNGRLFHGLNYSSKYLNFSGNPTSSSLEPNNGLLLGSYGNITSSSSQHVPYQTERGTLNQMGYSSLYQPTIFHRNNNHSPPAIPEETIKAITANPSFQSALATVLTSIINNRGDAKEQSE